MNDWPFADPRNVVAVTVRQVMDREKPILLVSRGEEDGCWQFHTGDGARMADAMVVLLCEVVEIDESLKQLADLPLGWTATRESKAHPWQREYRPSGAE